jgi:hypothetical protein
MYRLLVSHSLYGLPIRLPGKDKSPGPLCQLTGAGFNWWMVSCFDLHWHLFQALREGRIMKSPFWLTFFAKYEIFLKVSTKFSGDLGRKEVCVHIILATTITTLGRAVQG